MKSEGCPRKCWLAQVHSLKKELFVQDEGLETKINKGGIDKRECEEIEIALQHKAKLYAYRGLKQELVSNEVIRGTIVSLGQEERNLHGKGLVGKAS